MVPGDLISPVKSNFADIGDRVLEKGRQGPSVVVFFGLGQTSAFGAKEAQQITSHVFSTGRSINRVIFIKAGGVLAEHLRK